MRQSRVGVGVIGVGGISGNVHLPGLQLCPQAEIVALCDINTDLLSQRAEEYGVAHIFSVITEIGNQRGAATMKITLHADIIIQFPDRHSSKRSIDHLFV